MITSVKGQRRALQVVGNRSSPCFPGSLEVLRLQMGMKVGDREAGPSKPYILTAFLVRTIGSERNVGVGDVAGRTGGKYGGQPVGGRPGSLREPRHKGKWGIGGWLRGVGFRLWDLRRRGSLQVFSGLGGRQQQPGREQT